MERQLYSGLNLDNIGDICRQLRIQSNISQEEMAAKVGLAVSTIERIENKKVIPRADSMLNILSALNCQVNISKLIIPYTG
ncbi:helix-turn-helix transcriptional regulator [Zooshikella marina]|uniref:helix-turn-helix domain-containing protein n=1 Tax=Zooshikella ganghwensis TaxID=202772 RepID=UPI001BB02648|nr:helix-turn-helix transcriptional regulator [Zooshikella ganghwensis]MBU2705424.1 helix-turn-helix transcriptional regulator [Zooshikella ganghwensis]